MNIKTYKLTLGLLCGLMFNHAQAADISAGKDSAAACFGCHGANGVSSNGNFPNLAGQTPTYLAAQLHKFKAGSRVAPAMQAIAQGLTDSDIDNLATYFASLTSKSAGNSNPGLASQGQTKAAMCMGCHGGNMQGKGQFPKLAGQQPQYLSKQLHDFKNNSRQAGSMNAVAQSLSEEDIKAMAAYLAGLQ